MAACKVQCWQCGTAFYGRADARYCCGACRQKAHRARTRRRAADEMVPAPASGDAVRRAREARNQAGAVRDAVKRAREARQQASGMRVRATAAHRAADETIATIRRSAEPRRK